MPQVPEFAQVDYLVIAPQELLPAAKPLLNHRAKKYRVHGAELQDIYERYLDLTGGPEAAIRAYVYDVHRAGGKKAQLQYVLLFGDDGPDVTHALPVGYDPQRDVQSDSFYCTLGDGLQPDFACGRIPARTPAQAAMMGARIIAYEEFKQQGPARLNFYAAEGGFGPVEDAVLAGVFYANAIHLIPTHFQVDIHSDDRHSAFWSERRFADVMTAGNPFVVTYLGHGTKNNLQAREYIDYEDIAEVPATAGRPPIVNLLSCAAGCFAGGECFAEELLFHEHGPAAVIGSAVEKSGAAEGSTSPVVLNIFSHALLEYLGKPQGHRLGDVFLAAQRRANASTDIIRQVLTALTPPIQEALALSPEVEEDTRMQAMQMTLLGDPALVWDPGRALKPWQRRRRAWAGPFVQNAQDFMPPLRHPMSDRVSGAVQTAQPQTKTFALTEISQFDAEMLLHVLDYLQYSALRYIDREIRASYQGRFTWRDLVKNDVLRGFERSLPRPGTAQLHAGQLHINFPDLPIILPVSQLWKLQPELIHGVFPRGEWGTVSVGEGGRIALTASIPRTGEIHIDIASGIRWTSDDGRKERDVRKIVYDLNRSNPCITTQLDPAWHEDISTCPPPPSPEDIAVAQKIGRGLRAGWQHTVKYLAQAYRFGL